MPEKKILYVENDQGNQTMIRLFFRDEPYEVIIADNPDSGMKVLLSQHPDIIIVDMNLQKEGDGAELIHTIRNVPGCESIPIFVFSGYDKSHFSQYNIDGLIQRFFLKPTSKKTLIDAVREFDGTIKNHK